MYRNAVCSVCVLVCQVLAFCYSVAIKHVNIIYLHARRNKTEIKQSRRGLLAGLFCQLLVYPELYQIVLTFINAQGRLSPIRPWSKIPLLLALPFPYFLLPIPLSCPPLPPLFRGRNPLTPSPSPPLLSLSRPCKQGSGGFFPGENFSNLDGCR